MGPLIDVAVFLGVSSGAHGAGRPQRHKIPSHAEPLAPELPSAPSAATGLEFIDRHNAISLEVAHPFERGAARERVNQLLQFWREAYGVRSEWRGDRVFMQGTVRGVHINAVFDVADDVVTALARDPGWFWRARAHAYVEWMLKKYLHPTYQEPRGGW